MANRKKPPHRRTVQLPQREKVAPDDAASHAAFAKRLQILIKRAGNIVALAERAHVSDTSIHSWLRGSEPTREKLARLADEMNISLEWLIRGRGVMSADLIPEGYSVVRRLVNDPTTRSAVEGVDYLALKTEWIKSLPSSPSPDDLLLTEMEGDAMSPTIDPGDLVLINGRDRAVRDGIFGITHPTQVTARPPIVTIRRILDRSDGTFRLLYDNKSYPTEPSDERIFRLHGAVSVAGEAARLQVFGLKPNGDVFFAVLGRVIWSGGLI